MVLLLQIISAKAPRLNNLAFKANTHIHSHIAPDLRIIIHPPLGRIEATCLGSFFPVNWKYGENMWA